ncbi:MAG: thiosulfate oxidation carrier complex protein SoxZ [Campylobacterota bacterium]|nr:thiosulfate oxidation carrier complex protein SoxZ [Campylobacterota bacterium]
MARKSMIKIKPKKPKAGSIAKVSLMVMHPMETGLGKNKKTGKAIPAHFINDIDFQWNGKTFTKIEGWETISANPFYEVKLRVPEKGKLSVTFKDNQGEVITKKKKVKVKK